MIYIFILSIGIAYIYNNNSQHAVTLFVINNKFNLINMKQFQLKAKV